MGTGATRWFTMRCLIGDVGLRERLVGVAGAERHRERDVRAERVVHVRRSRGGLLGIDDGRHLLVLDDDLLRRVAREVRRVGDDDRDRVADEAHFVERERVVRRRLEVGHLVRDRQRGLEVVRVVQVLAGVDREDVLVVFERRGVDARDLRVAVRAAHERGIHGADLAHVVDVRRAAGDEAGILAAPDARADHRGERHYAFASCSCCGMMPSPLGGGSSVGGWIGISSLTLCRASPLRIAAPAARTAFTMFS